MNGLAELEVKISYPNLVDKSLCISPVRASGTIAFFERGGIYNRGKGIHPFLTYHRRFLICPLLDAFGVGSDATTAKPSVANEGADKRLSRTTYRFVGHKVRALPEYPN